MEDARDGRWTRFRSGECLHDLSHLPGTQSFDKHLTNGLVQFVATALIAFKQLGVVAPACPRHRQVRDLTHARLQMARVMPIALILTLLIAFIGQDSYDSIHFCISDAIGTYAYGFTQLLLPLC